MTFLSTTLCFPGVNWHTKLTRSIQRPQSGRRETPYSLPSIDKGRTMDTANVGWPCSLWVAVTPPGPDLPRWIGTAAADVGVIGGRFTRFPPPPHFRTTA